MKYANTIDYGDGIERVLVVLPLDQVPYFDPENPPQSNTYGVPDDVQVGWVKYKDGTFGPAIGEYRPVPQVVSRFQGRAALLQANLLDDVEEYMQLPDTDPFYKLAWKEATQFLRQSPMVQQMKTILNLTDSQLDDLFIFAATIQA